MPGVNGKIALVIGAVRGIGQAIAEFLAGNTAAPFEKKRMTKQVERDRVAPVSRIMG